MPSLLLPLTIVPPPHSALAREKAKTQVVLNLGGQQNQTDSILFESCTIRSSPESGLWILNVAPGAPAGIITLRNVSITETGDFGLRIEKTAGNNGSLGAAVNINDTSITNVATKGHFPVLIQGGGVTFTDVTIVDNNTHPRNWLEAGWRTNLSVTVRTFPWSISTAASATCWLEIVVR